jgi:hypothetical protein
MRRRPFLCLVAVVALVVALIGSASIVAPPAAEAAGVATLARDVYLVPNPPAGSVVFIDRDIYLAAGTYAWRAVLTRLPNGGSAGGYREIYLESGTYYWVMNILDTNQESTYQAQSSLFKVGSSASVGGYVDVFNAANFNMASTLRRI